MKIEIIKGLLFRSKWFKGLVEVIKVSPESNQLKVKITRTPEHYHFEDWDLQVTIWGFENLEYTVEQPEIIKPVFS